MDRRQSLSEYTLNADLLEHLSDTKELASHSSKHLESGRYMTDLPR